MAAVGDVVDDDDNNIMQCTQHPFKNTSPGGGICAFCLQDKLGKLVSSSTSSSSSSFLPLSSSSTTTTTTTTSLSLNHHTTTQPKAQQNLPFLLTPKKNKSFNDSLVLKRSKSTAHYETSTPRRRGFWSFLHLPHKKTKPLELVVVEEKEETQTVIKPDNIIKNETRLYQGKVTRSRSVGCGSRSFSGDLFERISTGFGDCSTLRRVESQREGGAARIKHRHSTSTAIREKVLCGGLFGGFMMITSSSSSTSTSSSSYWVTNTADNNNNNNNNNATGRSKSWGWALASPRRAGKRETSNNGNAQNATTTTTTTTVASDVSKTPNLAAIPSLLSVRS